MRQRAGSDEQLLLGLERSVFDSSAIYLMVNPQYQKESMDLALGYTIYKDDREQYVRAGLFLEDFTYATKNRVGATSEQEQIALQWQVRLELGNEWYLYTDGEVGNGFDRAFDNPTKSPEIAGHQRRENAAEISISRFEKNGLGWSFWVEWYDFMEATQFRQPGSDYDFNNTQFNVSAEHTRVVGDRHRWRFLVHYVEQRAESIGAGAHIYDRTDLLGGASYEYLWQNSGAALAYAFGQPDVSYMPANSVNGFEFNDYTDKLIASWRYRFSNDAQVRLTLSHEVSNQGFGGGSVQFQMFF